MGTKRTKGKTAGRVNLHLVVDADVASRFRAFAGHHGRSYGDVFAEAVRMVTRGFSVSVRQEGLGVRLPAVPEAMPADPGRGARTEEEGEAA